MLGFEWNSANYEACTQGCGPADKSGSRVHCFLLRRLSGSLHQLGSPALRQEQTFNSCRKAVITTLAASVRFRLERFPARLSPRRSPVAFRKWAQLPLAWSTPLRSDATRGQSAQRVRFSVPLKAQRHHVDQSCGVQGQRVPRPKFVNGHAIVSRKSESHRARACVVLDLRPPGYAIATRYTCRNGHMGYALSSAKHAICGERA